MSTRATQRLGVTMRVDVSLPHGEARDALAQEWAALLAYALPEVSWVPLPNLGDDIVRLVQEFRLDGFLLTGGNDIGDSPARDRTEAAVLRYAMEHHLPALGVCRGLQMMQHFFGGGLQPVDTAAHVATRHAVRLHAARTGAAEGTTELLVNSFHRYGVRREALASALTPIAETADGWVEGLAHRNFPLRGIMWHPERETPFRVIDRVILRATFGMDEP